MTVSSSAVFLCGKTGTSLDGSTQGDAFVAKYFLNGQPLWDRLFQLSSIGRDKCNAIVVHGDRDVYIGGFTTGLLFSAERVGQGAQPPGFEYTSLNQAFIAHLRERNTSDLRSPAEINTAPSDAPPLTRKELVVVRGRQKYGYGDAAVDFVAVVFNRLVYTSSITYRGRVTSYLHEADPESVSPWHMQMISTRVGVPSLTVRFMDEVDKASTCIDYNRRTGSTFPSNIETPNLLHGHIGGFRVTDLHLVDYTQDLFVVGCDADADTAHSETGTGTGWVAITVLKYAHFARTPTCTKVLTSGMVLPDPAHMQLHSPKIAVDVHSHSVYVHVYLPLVLPNSTSSNASSGDKVNPSDARLSLSSLSSLDGDSESDDDFDGDDNGDGEGESPRFLHSALFILDEGSGDVVRVWNR